MLIKDLKEDYPLVYEAAINNFDEEFARDCCFYLEDEYFEEDCMITEAFKWEQSKEGFTFWSEIDNYNFDEAKQICPHLFEDKNEFKTNDYVVCLPKSPRECSGAGFKSNYCVKIRRVDSYVLWYYYDNEYGIYKEECRKATQEEIEEYDRIGKPYDVTTLKSKPKPKPKFEVGKWYKNLGTSNSIAKLHNISDNEFWHTDHIHAGKNFQKGTGNAYYTINSNTELIDISEIQEYLPDGHPDKISKSKSTNLENYIGRYLKALVDYPTGGTVKKGEYGLIINSTDANFPNHTYYSCSKALEEPDKYELMPEGFNPDKVEEDFKVGDWVIGWFQSKNDYRHKAWQIGKIYGSGKNIFVVPKEHPSWNTDIGTIRKALPHEIPIIKPVEKEVDVESILQKAKRRYPIGTKVECLVLNKPVVITGHGEKHPAGVFRSGAVYFDVKGNQTRVYKDGKWAEVIELPKEKSVTARNKTSEWIKLETEEERKQAANYLKDKGFKCASAYNDYDSFSKWLHIYYDKGKPYSYQFLTSLADSTYIQISKSDLGINTTFKSKVLHVDTQEKWDFVLKQENYKYIHKSTWKSHKQNSCLTLDEEGYSHFDYFKGENYQILSFNEYLLLNLLDYEWEKYLNSLKVKPDENVKVDYENYFVEDEWYIVQTGWKWLIKYKDWYQGGPRAKLTLDLERGKEITSSNAGLCSKDDIKLARKATKGEVEQHFPNEFDTKKKDVYFSWEVFQYPVAKEDSFNKDEFMEPIKVKPYKKSKSKIKLIF